MLKDLIQEPSLDLVFRFFRKFALPLLFGIFTGLIVANVDEEYYDKWYAPEAHHSVPNSNTSGRLLASGGSCSSAKPNILGLKANGHLFTLNFFVNEILMCFFFGLAIKEIVESVQPGGSLYPPGKKIVNPIVATLGGVLGPVAAYLILLVALGNYLDEDFSELARGWGIVTATDISLAWVTSTIIFGRRHPAVKYLLLLAIVDDGMGLIIIATYYSDPASPIKAEWLCLVLVAMVVAYALRALRTVHWGPYVFIAGPISVRSCYGQLASCASASVCYTIYPPHHR